MSFATNQGRNRIKPTPNKLRKAALLGGLALFAVIALLILYAYYKGQLDRNQNGIPDLLERNA